MIRDPRDFGVHVLSNAYSILRSALLNNLAYGKVYLVRKVSGVDKDKLYAMKVLRKESLVTKTKTAEHTRTEREVSSCHVCGFALSLQNTKWLDRDAIAAAGVSNMHYSASHVLCADVMRSCAHSSKLVPLCACAFVFVSSASHFRVNDSCTTHSHRRRHSHSKVAADAAHWYIITMMMSAGRSVADTTEQFTVRPMCVCVCFNHELC